MPYYISQAQSDCDGWATVKQEANGSYTTIGCHQNKTDAIDQMVATSLAENIEPGGEVNSRSKMKKIERRTYTVQDVETRADDDGKLRLSGYAAKFDSPSVPLPFREIIAPGAFRKTLTEIPDVRLLVNHEGLPLARTKNGTLVLTEDNVGLRFDAELADTQESRDLHALIARGDVDQMSFAFRVIRQKWNENRTERVLTEVSLADGDVSVVTYPAYPATSVEAREHLKSAIQAVKEGREISGESLLVLKNIFEDLSEGHDYVMKSVEVMAQLLGMQEIEAEAELEDSNYENEEDKNVLEEEVLGRSISLRLAQALVNSTK
jgi:hypothetical protein